MYLSLAMEVKVIHRNSARACECCSSWLKHWEKITKEDVGTCRTKSCTNPSKVGAHVKRKSGDNTWRIVPLCHDCNKRTDWITLNKHTTSAPAEQGGHK
ncbi:hypothetical protein [Ekhidna sp.]